MSSDRLVIDLDSVDPSKAITDTRYIPQIVYNNKNFLIISTTIILLILFSLLSIAQILPWTPLDNFIAFQDIQKNFNKWSKVIDDFQVLESNKITNLKPYMRNYNQLACIDYGSFYLPITFSNYTGSDGKTLILPTAVRRGNGDGWMVTKSDVNDPAAYQQCLYVASEASDNLISCGLDMYNKLGYGGYLNSGHWCNEARSKLYTYYKVE